MPLIFYLWITLAMVFVMLELGHPGMLYFLSFAVGAGCASIASLIWVQNFVAQQVTFLITTVTAIAILRRGVRSWFQRGHAGHRTNVDALVGQRGVVVDQIMPDKPGQVRVAGQVWRARAADSLVIDIGEPVMVIAVKGAHVVVQRV